MPLPLKLLLRLLSLAAVGLIGPRVLAGNLNVTLTPAQAVAAGAQWRVDNGAWRNSGTSANGLSNATHTVEFKAAPGWVTPASRTVTLSQGNNPLTQAYTQAASLTVALAPASAQWQVDGGAWNASGVTVGDLAPGAHTIGYATLNNYSAPATEAVTLVAGQTTQVSRTYVALAQVTVSLTPATAQWSIDGGAWQASGATVQNLASGAHTIVYNGVAGYSAPAAESVTLASGQSLSLDRSYIQLASITLTLNPGWASWRVDGGAIMASGATVANLAPGPHTLDYLLQSGWWIATPESVTLTAGQAFTATRTATQLAQLAVNFPLAAGYWRIDGGPWSGPTNGAMDIFPGQHTVDYQARAGWTAPASETITASGGQATTLNPAFVQLGAIRVTLTPGTAQWSIDGSAPQSSGNSWSDLAPGVHSVSYLPVAGYVTPAAENVTIVSGQTLDVSRAYVQMAEVSITLAPSAGQWRINGGTWQASGASQLAAPGPVTIDYSALALYDPPANDTPTLAPGGAFVVARNYVSQRPKLRVELTPAAGQWRLDGGAWQPSGTQLVELDAGAHTIDYSDVGGDYNPLASETINLALRDNTTLARAYPLKPASLTIALNIWDARWRATGPVTTDWFPQGIARLDLPPGTYTVEYQAIANYDAPAAETVALAPNQNLSFSRTYAAHPAQVSLTLDQPAAQWRIYPSGDPAPSGAWQASGATVSGLIAPGGYRIEYGNVPGYNPPTLTNIFLQAGQAYAASPTYQPIPPRILGNLNPYQARFRVNGGEWQLPSAWVTLPAPGSYLVEFIDVPNYYTPAARTLTLGWGDSYPLDVSYAPVPPASLTVQTQPGGGQFRVDGGAWFASGTSLTAINAGSHTIEFGAQTGYITPAPVTLQLAPSEVRVYTQPYSVGAASLRVNLTGDIGRWRVDGGAWLPGAGIVSFSSGPHVLEFEATPGYVAPAAENLLLAVDENRVITRTYLLNTASVAVTLTPASGQWRIYSGPTPSGAWNASGATVSGLDPGTYNVAYAEVSGYATPPIETIALAAGDVRSLTRSYGAPLPGYAEIVALPDLGYGPYLMRGTDNVLYGVASTNGGNGGGTFFRVNPDGTAFSLLRAFPMNATDGTAPTFLIEGSDGYLYGTCNYGGGATNKGIVFRSNRDGSGFTALRVFTVAADGYSPNTIYEASDGWLYGTTLTGGSPADGGTVFKMMKDGTGYTVLKSFASISVAGRHVTRLTEGPTGELFGLASTSNNSSTAGLVFRLNKDGANFAVVKQFAGGADGASPRAPLLRSTDGFLYGTTGSGGASNKGTAFRLNADGSGHAIFKHFAGTTAEGGGPSTEFVEDATGTFYGGAASGGTGTRGVIYRMNRDGTGYATIKNFAGDAAEGGVFLTSPISLGGGVLSGATRIGGGANDGTIVSVNVDGTGFAVLKHLSAPLGGSIMTPVTEGPGGALYGTTLLGGLTREGTVFKVNKDGTGLTVLRHFNGVRGSYAQSVIAASDGKLYGAGYHELYRLNADGTGLGQVHDFTAEGASPQAVIEGGDGALYGVTDGGGTAAAGSVFKVNKDGTGYVVLKSFAGGASDGRYPYSGVTEGADGFLYGMTVQGGPANLGSVYRLGKDGTGYAVLKFFVDPASDGSSPWSTVTFGSDNFLYGVTTAGGTASFGAIFRIAPDGTGFTLLHSFQGTAGGEGSGPNYAGVIEHNGLLYGVTAGGGVFGRGTLYKMNRDGTGYTTLINFGAGGFDGSVPPATLYRSADGSFYGTTHRGGAGSTVFRFTP